MSNTMISTMWFMNGYFLEFSGCKSRENRLSPHALHDDETMDVVVGASIHQGQPEKERNVEMIMYHNY
eukprot:15364729-Ditylum_brightwellii.AAC.1